MSNENPNPDRYPLGEPSVLDYVKSLFRFGNGERIRIPEFVEDEEFSGSGFQPSVTDLQWVEAQPEVIVAEQPAPSNLRTAFPWRSLLAFFLALVGQRLFEPPAGLAPIGYAFYIGAVGLLGWAIQRGELTLPALAESSHASDPLTYRPIQAIAGVILILAAFLYFTNNLFTIVNVLLWLAAIALFVWAFWLNRFSARQRPASDQPFLKRYGWTMLVIAATVLVFFFRFYRTVDVPPEPFSDHAEKILDVYDVSQGQTHIFFTRNTGREAFQMYWTLLVSWVFGTGLSFLSLKLGTAILGFLTLPFVYLIGKEIGGPRVGLFAFVMTGIGYWPNVISRVGLRFPLYP
ncbi:MAG: hypothetical protein ACM3Y8_07150, partial [Byssovorax cruenta]